MKPPNIRPERFEDYIGQADTKAILGISIQAAKELGLPLDHVLLNGPPGLGKTTLARIVAKEMGWKIKTAIGSAIKTPNDIKMLVLAIPKTGKTMIFIDEIHRVSKPAQEVLYPILEDGVFQYKINWSTQSMVLPALTIVGATTNAGRLAQPFVDRFGLQFQLKFYEDNELLKIAKLTMNKYKMSMTDDALMEVIHRSRATPRMANRLLKRLLDFKVAQNIELTAETTKSILWKYFSIDEKGLLPLDRKVLRVMDKVVGPVGIESIAILVGEEPETIEARVEPYLMRIGFMMRDARGRSITDVGRAYLESRSR